jgi:hypothetical protein
LPFPPGVVVTVLMRDRLCSNNNREGRTSMAQVVQLLMVALLVLRTTAALQAQTTSRSESAEAASELVHLLDNRGIEAIAAPDPTSPDAFVAALYFPGSQLLESGHGIHRAMV